MNPLILFPVLIAALYALMATVCICGRMDRATKWWVRVPIVLLAFLSFLAVARTIWGEWQFSIPDFGLAAAVMVGAVILARLPRIRT
jgi:hypothetical protein